MRYNEKIRSDFEVPYVKVSSSTLEETSRLMTLISEATGLQPSGLRPNGSEFIGFLIRKRIQDDGDNPEY